MNRASTRARLAYRSLFLAYVSALDALLGSPTSPIEHVE